MMTIDVRVRMPRGGDALADQKASVSIRVDGQPAVLAEKLSTEALASVENFVAELRRGLETAAMTGKIMTEAGS